jgi:hypothetical protein
LISYREVGEMKYVMLILNTEAAGKLTAEEYEAWSSQIMAWYEKNSASGVLADGGAQLQGPETAKTVRVGGVTDGPFMESKEVLGGYSVLETETIDEAAEVAKGWPGVDRGLVTMELRPVVVF